MAKAEVIAIGSELLLGETQDSNTFYLLRILRNLGVNVFRTMMIGDNPGRIAEVINESFTRAEIVITTGGLGPTIDDPTREATALAFNSEVEFRPEVWAIIEAYFKKMGRNATENNKRQAYFPKIAHVIPNPVGTAPAYYIHQGNKLLISLPGVPGEMKYLTDNAVIPLIRQIFPGQGSLVIKTLHTFGIGESVVDELVDDLEKSQNPTLGLSAKQGQIDLRITAKGSSEEDARNKAASFEKLIRDRLGEYIYGADGETLSVVVSKILEERKLVVHLHESGTDGLFCRHLDPKWFHRWETSENKALADLVSRADQTNICQHLPNTNGAYLIGRINRLDDGYIDGKISFFYNGKEAHFQRKYLSLIYNPEQLVMAALDLVRRTLIN